MCPVLSPDLPLRLMFLQEHNVMTEQGIRLCHDT